MKSAPVSKLADAIKKAKRNSLSDAMLIQLRGSKLPVWTTEYKFHPVRKWRFDYCWPQYSVAVEIEGGVWNHGAHVRGAHFESDAEKYNEAARLGWVVGRFTGGMVKRGEALAWIEKVLAEIMAQRGIGQ